MAFASMLWEQELNNISVTELCKAAIIDRSTFYANFEAEKVDGLQLTFAIFTELLKICTGNNLLAEN